MSSIKSIFNQPKFIPTVEITPDVLSYWKRKYSDDLFEFSIANKIGYFRNLTANDFKNELEIFGKTPVSIAGKEIDAVNFSMKLIQLAMLGGDIEILKEECYKTEVLNQVGDIVLIALKDKYPHLSAK